MKIAIISINKSSYNLIQSIEKRYSFSFYEVKNSGKSLKEIYKEIKDIYDIIIFIANIGITVRAISSHLESKWKDPGIISIDTLGKYIVPIVGGHWGLANSVAKEIGMLIGATPIITTRSELLKITPFDLIARKNNLYIENPYTIKTIATRFSEDKNMKVFTDLPVRKVPLNITICNLKNIIYKDFGVIISERKFSFLKRDSFLFLRPKNIVVGIGYRRKESSKNLKNALNKALSLFDISPFSVDSVSTINIKKGDGIIDDLADTYAIRYIDKKELLWIDKVYPGSSWVRKVMGIGSVSFSTMLYGYKGVKIILESENIDGIMISIGKIRKVINFES